MTPEFVDPSSALSDEVQRLAGMGFWKVDLATDRVTWSQNLTRLYGLGENAGPYGYADVFQFVHPDDHEPLNETFVQAVTHQRDWAQDHRILRPDGEIRWVHSRGRVQVRDGEVVGLVGTTTDISDRKAIEENLRQFAANASHELRTPATAILNAVELLRSGKVRPDQADSVIAVLSRQAERLLALTDTILDMSRIADGPQRLLLSPVDVRATVERAAATFDTSDGPATVTTRVEGDPTAHASAVELERVIVNLVQNGLRHGAPPVTVTAHEDGSEVVIVVEDAGPGVELGLRSELFTPFARSESGGGSGLGLSMVRALLRSMGGSVEHAPLPEAPGRFVVRLGRES